MTDSIAQALAIDAQAYVKEADDGPIGKTLVALNVEALEANC